MPHWDIDLAMKKSEIINNLKLVDFKTFLITFSDSLDQNAFITQFLVVGQYGWDNHIGARACRDQPIDYK